MLWFLVFNMLITIDKWYLIVVIAHLFNLRIVLFDPSFEPLEKLVLTSRLVDGAEGWAPVVDALDLLEPQLLAAAQLLHDGRALLCCW